MNVKKLMAKLLKKRDRVEYKLLKLEALKKALQDEMKYLKVNVEKYDNLEKVSFAERKLYESDLNLLVKANKDLEQLEVKIKKLTNKYNILDIILDDCQQQLDLFKRDEENTL